MDARALIPMAAAAGGALGYVLGRGREHAHVRHALRSNFKALSRQERALVGSLLLAGKGYLFSGWPAAGQHDERKQRLLSVLAQRQVAAASSEEIEESRLALLLPPKANTAAKELTAHGDVRVDDYYWLRDDARKAPAVLTHLEAENAYTRAVLADTEPLQEALVAEMRARIQEADQSVPTRRGGWLYYSRTLEGAQYKVHCRRAVTPGSMGQPASEDDQLDPQQPEQVLLDENKRKEEGKHSFYMVGSCEESPNHALLAWTEDTEGGEKYTLHVKDLASGQEVMSPLEGTSGDVMWANDNATLFYVVKDELDRPYKVFRRSVGRQAAGEADVLVYHEADEQFYVGIHKSHSEALLMISSGSAVTSETRICSADTPIADFVPVMERQHDVEYSVVHRGPCLVLLVREKDKPNGELRVMPLGGSPDQAQVLVPHSREVKLEGLSVSRRFLTLNERRGGLQRVRVYRLEGESISADALGAGEEVTFEEPAYSLEGGCVGDFDSPLLRLEYTSLTTPYSTYDHNMATGRRVLKKVSPVLGGFVQSAYTTERLWATASDGVRVPISLVYRKGAVKLDGSDPLLLNGYGSYEISNDPYFSANRLCLLDRGWVFAVAHIRGGGEMGRYWYEDGKFLHKRNTFTDFIACAEHLVSLKYTSSARMAIEGRSAGGLLMGAVLNMRPDLFHAALVGVGFVDVVTTMSDETIPLTTIEWEEWGNPADPAYYAYMKSYSPMDNVRAQDYPHIFVTAGLHDPRVAYWEPAKFVAKLREHKTNQRLLLFKCEMGAGHFSVTGRFDRLKEVAQEYAFLLKVSGMTHTAPATAA